ncbi:MAG: hypothetical protein M1829_004633 [Trizodia sp. TS-e1964]|nr:MAG: hypothetical protein M1829_004633 [Trizodia sp. TS-e1964]
MQYFSGGAAISTFAITHGGNITATGSHHFNLTRPAPLPARQAAAHPHQAVVDPTGKFLVIPDLGADLIRVFGIGISGALTEQDPFGVSLGSGPRHSVFWRANGVTYLFIITEISNTVIQFSVKYTTAGISLQRVGEISTFGKQPAPSGAAAGEIAISPDKKFLVLSNRNDSSFSLPNHNPQNSTRELSDSLATFSLDLSQPSNSCIRFVELFPAGGSFPRQFSFNKKGDMVAVGLQLSGRVMVFSRDVNTGAFGYPLAEIDIDGQVSCVIWDE